MPKKLENPSRFITRWNGSQLSRMEEIIIGHRAMGQNVVKWSDHVDELSHHLRSIYSMARTIRSRMATRERAAYRAEIRAALEPVGTMEGLKIDPIAPRPRPVPSTPRLSPKFVFDVERTNTSTQALLFTVEMRNRIGSQGITAGLLGDPPPGRSALDEKRGTAIIHVTIARLKTGRAARVPSLATRLDRDLR